jgi:purine-nucleoside phosphorylase
MNAAYLGARAFLIVTITDHFITSEQSTSEEREKGFLSIFFDFTQHLPHFLANNFRNE